MTSENAIRGVWQADAGESAPMSLEEVRRRAAKLERDIGRRNQGEYLACALLVPLFGLIAWVDDDPLLRAAAALSAAAGLFVAWQLHRRGAVRPPGPALGCLAFHRAELERQRDALRLAWLWYFAPFLPGQILFVASSALEPGHETFALGHGLLVAILFVGGILLNLAASRGLQREVDSLSEFETAAG